MVIASVLVVVALAAVTGLALASAIVGGGWVWPHGNNAIGHVVGGILTGHPGRGLDGRQSRLTASPTFSYVGIAACEIAAIGLSAVVGVVITRYRRPGDARGGMATRREAEQALGMSRLREAKAIIRPDLYAAATATHPSASRNGLLSTRRVRVHRSGVGDRGPSTSRANVDTNHHHRKEGTSQ